MRKSFITGLVILLPLALTLVIVMFLVNLLTDPFAGLVQGIFGYYGIFSKGFLFLSAVQVKHYVSQVLILTFLFFFTVLLGFLTRWFFVHYFIRFWDAILHRIPFIRSIYKTTQDVIKTIFASKTSSFKQVVLVPFPNPETYGIGLVTKENLPSVEGATAAGLVAVFVPTTPNPTSGFLMMYRPDDIIYLDMGVEEAFKYVISCGVLPTPFKAISREEAQKKANDLLVDLEDK